MTHDHYGLNKDNVTAFLTLVHVLRSGQEHDELIAKANIEIEIDASIEPNETNNLQLTHKINE